MKTISDALAAHLAQPVTTLATCWKVTRGDGSTFGFCDFSADILFDEQLYKAASGIAASNIKTSDKLDVDNLEVDSILSADTLTDADLLAGLWDGARVEIFLVNWADLSMGALSLRSGFIGEVKTGRTKFTAELRGLSQKLQQSIGRVYGIDCDADLGDARCQISLSGFTVSASVSTVTDGAHFTAAALTQADGYFDAGLITFTSGANAGRKMEVKTFTTGVVNLQQPMPFALAVDDTFSIHAGCDKSLATCRDRFNNVINFRGFPYIPGSDRMVSGK